MKIIKSTVKGKKWTAIFNDGKKVQFGAEGYEDYTLHKDKKRRANYRSRHSKDLTTESNKIGRGAGALSYYILWGNSTDIKKNIRDYKKRFNV